MGGGGSLNNNNASSRKYAIVFGIFALVIVTTAASFAFFTYSRTGQTTTTITSGDIEFTYKEGEDASLANAFPVSDSVGANDTSEEYTFTVNLKSTSQSNKMNYNVYLLDANDDANTNYFTNEQIKFALIKDNVFVAGTSATEGKKLSSIAGFTAGEHEGEGLVLESQEITAGKTDEYKLRIWISDDVNYSNTDRVDDNTDVNNDAQTSTGKYNGYKYSLKVKITSEVTTASILIENLIVNKKTMTADLTDVSGLDSYAVTTSSTVPANDSSEWLVITNSNAKSNIQKVSDELVTFKSISHTVNNDGTYYLHVKNKLNQTLSKKFIVNTIPYKDNSGANIPEILTGMIPVTYDGTNWVKADETEKWYDYDNQWWANVVTVSNEKRDTYMNAKVGTPISMDDINTMWVWIPRYEYETITSTSATEINVNFLSGTESNKTDNYITHPAFTFGTDNLTGLWVAKFEASSETWCNVIDNGINNGCDLTTLKVNVKPNVIAWRGIRISTADLNTRAMNDSENIYGFVENEVDTHVMKNIEWGTVAYLTQSKYGRCENGTCTEVTLNSSSDYITGYSNVAYSDDDGVLASTTGNIYGIYDMAGGSWEVVMGVTKDNTSDNPMSGLYSTYNSGFTGTLYNKGQYTPFDGRNWPETKYYDLYDFGTTYNDSTAYARYKTGDATTETKGWYNDFTNFITAENSWFIRGGYNGLKVDGSIVVYVEEGGIFGFSGTNGYASPNGSFRPVLIKK